MSENFSDIARTATRRRTPRVAKPPRGHLTEAAYQHVKGLILEGLASPGSKLDPNAIVAMLDASRQPVMMALRRLASEGFVDIAPQSGCRVSVPDRPMIGDFFRAFAAVEAVAAEIAAERAAPDGLAQLALINDEIGALGRQARLSPARKSERYRRLNQKFHRCIHEIGRSGLVAALSESFWDRADFYIACTSGTSPFAARISTSYREHRAVIDAIARRAPAEARQLMEAHIRSFASTA